MNSVSHYKKERFWHSEHHSSENIRLLKTDSLEGLRASTESRSATAVLNSDFCHKL